LNSFLGFSQHQLALKVKIIIILTFWSSQDMLILISSWSVVQKIMCVDNWWVYHWLSESEFVTIADFQLKVLCITKGRSARVSSSIGIFFRLIALLGSNACRILSSYQNKNLFICKAGKSPKNYDFFQYLPFFCLYNVWKSSQHSFFFLHNKAEQRSSFKTGYSFTFLV